MLVTLIALHLATATAVRLPVERPDAADDAPSEINCRAVSSSCLPCAEAEMVRPYCSLTGFRQEVRCSVTVTNASDNDAYSTFQGCALGALGGDVGAVVRLELLMAACFAASFTVVLKRKRRARVLQQDRIREYFN
jgi:hypothetical protein